MAITPAKRKAMETKIFETFNRLDPSGVNTAKYKKLFKGMSNVQFDQYFKNMFSREDDYLVLDTVDYERELRIEHIKAAAEYLKVPLMERVAMPYIDMNTNSPVVTKVDVPVGYVHTKRTQQVLSKKNTTSTEAGSRSALTGQVVGKDKHARDSDAENFALVTIGADDTLREFLGPRADDAVMKNEMYAAIAKNGFTSLNTLTNDTDNKTTLNALDAHLLGMGLSSDLVTDTLLLRKTLDN